MIIVMNKRKRPQKEAVTFHDYRKVKPSDEGWYIWRLPHKFIEGVTVIFLSKYRERGAGYETVMSPQFDYWDGYQVLLPKGSIEWAEYDGEPPKPGHNLIDIVETDNLPCPFCQKVPTWRYSGRHITAEPNDTDYFYLECCRWFDGFGNRHENPLKLTEKRNSLLKIEREAE